jgi:hypothetical protein
VNHKEKRVLIGLTTTAGSDWKEKTDEIRQFGMKELALFPTGLDRRGRDELYRRLEEAKVESIPHVHLRGDMIVDELRYLKSTYGTRAFNVHPAADRYGYPIVEDPADRGMIFFENTKCLPTGAELDTHGGLCIDFSHWECAKSIGNTGYSGFEKTVRKYRTGCCHVSAFPLRMRSEPSALISSNLHYLQDLRDLDYMADYVEYLPDLISIELENPFRDQLIVKNYLERMLSGRGCPDEERPGHDRGP